MTSVPLSSSGLSVLPTVLLVAVAVFFGFVLLVGVFVVVVVASRAEPEPTGRRSRAVYQYGVSFFAVFASLFASFAVVSGLVQLIGTHPEIQGGSQHPVGDAVARVVVLAGLILLVGVALLATHLRPALRLQDLVDGGPGPLSRIGQSYVSSVSFVAVVVGAASVVVFLYQVFRILGPGVFELSGSRVAAARVLLDALYLALASMVILATHLRLAPDLVGTGRPLPPPPGPLPGGPGWPAAGPPPAGPPPASPQAPAGEPPAP